jgi:hypothetical protein
MQGAEFVLSLKSELGAAAVVSFQVAGVQADPQTFAVVGSLDQAEKVVVRLKPDDQVFQADGEGHTLGVLKQGFQGADGLVGHGTTLIV